MQAVLRHAGVRGLRVRRNSVAPRRTGCRDWRPISTTGIAKRRRQVVAKVEEAMTSGTTHISGTVVAKIMVELV